MIENVVAELTRNEGLKQSDPLLTGTISQALDDSTAVRFSDDDHEFLKYHGIYQQDDRDRRRMGKQFMLMVRTKFPGGVLSAEQYLTCDRLADLYGNRTLRITTRQDFQFHGILKSNLRHTIKNLNEALITTLGACGDLNRNVMAPPTPATSPLVDRVLEEARRVSDALQPTTHAYHSIWLEGKELDLSDPANASFLDPLYASRYLPRKFKTAFAIPPLNDIDIFTNDLGFVVITEAGSLAGYNVLAGGGMGMSHGNIKTFPRLADVIGFIRPDQVEAVARAVVSIHRDFGDRTNRKHARLKYVLEERGVDWFRREVEARAGIRLAPARPFRFTRQGDLLGWHQQTDGNWFLGLFVENGRIKDSEAYHLKTALRRVIEQFRPEIRLTPSQNILLVNVKPGDRGRIDALLKEHGISPAHASFTPVRLAAMACPALPTCGLALAESERVLPRLLSKLEDLLAELGLDGEEIIVRMTGCPNGCARPYMAEIAFVGKAPGKYQIYLGGSRTGTRLNRLYKDSVGLEDLIAELRPVLARFAEERIPGERLGDFCDRLLWRETPAPAAVAAAVA